MTEQEIKTKITSAIERGKTEGSYFSMSGLVVDVGAFDANTICAKVSSQYDSPPFNSGVIFALCEAFETKKIDSDQFSYRGCETCDYGSSYGYDLTITLPENETT